VHQELEVSVLLVVVGFVLLLGLFQVVTYLREELITLCQLLSHRRNARRARLVRADGGGGGHGQRPPETVMCAAMIGRPNCSKTRLRATIEATAAVDHLLDNGGTW
jgi:hypothetical protein